MNTKPGSQDIAKELAEKLVQVMQFLGIQNRDGTFSFTMKFHVENDKVTDVTNMKMKRDLEI